MCICLNIAIYEEKVVKMLKLYRKIISNAGRDKIIHRLNVVQ